MDDNSRPTSVDKNKIFNGQVQAHTAARWTETVGVTAFWFRWFVLERWNECHGYQIMSEIDNAYYGPISSPANVKMRWKEMRERSSEEYMREEQRRSDEKSVIVTCWVWCHGLCNTTIDQIPTSHEHIISSSNSQIVHCWDWRNGMNSRWIFEQSIWVVSDSQWLCFGSNHGASSIAMPPLFSSRS